ncbi:MAG: RsmE family RNA methyltransferase [Planctomycetota bacterium]|jgi:16S rRNA (uracil1498-N3)-methyltransferase
MANPWFHVEAIPGAGEVVTIAGEEARHALRSRRLSAGDEVCLFDGTGIVAEAVVERVAPRDRCLDVCIRSLGQSPPPMPPVHVAAALPKGDRQATMLSMITQLGAASFTPLVTEHGVAAPGAGFASRAGRVVLQTCKQARRGHALAVHDPASIDGLMARVGERPSVLIADPCGERLGSVTGSLEGNAVWILVGPEGGFTANERDAALGCGAIAVSLGANILRIETAVVGLTAAVLSAVASPGG